MKNVFASVMLFAILAATSLAGTKYATASEFLTPAKSAVPGLATSSPLARAYDFSATSAKKLLMGPEKSLVLSNFPVGVNEQGTLELTEASSPFGLETQAWKFVNGKRVKITLPSARSYSGSIKGESGSRVLVVMAGDELYGTIERASGLMMQVAPSTTKQNTVLMMDNTHAPSPSFSCDFENMPEAHMLTNPVGVPDVKKVFSPQASDLLQCKVAVETDRFLWAKMGKDEAKITKYLYTIFATVSWIYEREVSVNFVLGDILIHTDEDPDPYTENANGDIGALLEEYSNFWKQNFGSIKRNVTVLFTVPGKTDVGGIAYLGSLCHSNGYAACGIRTTSSLPTSGYQWDAFVTAHEVGHTFSSPHTHGCFWAPPLDSCVSTTGNPPIPDACINGKAVANKGSIMSYCHLIIGENPGPRYTFLPRVAAQVRKGAESQGCLVAPPTATIKVTQPIGGSDQIVRIDTGVAIEWASTKVSTVNIEYSLDGGASFKTIPSAVNLPAADRAYRWMPPAGTASVKAMIRIFDPSAPTVADTSYATFTLGAPTLTLLGWTGGERIGRKSTELLQWTRTFLSTNTVEFSATGSDPWTPIVTETNATQYSWKVPDIETSTARLRLVGANGAVITTSEQFAIGTPVLKILTPVGADSACSGYKMAIRWQSDFVRQVEVRYSRNGGASYPLTQVINAGIDARTSTVIWTVPKNKETDSAMIRLLCVNDTGTYAFSKLFAIKGCTFDVYSVRESAEMNGIRIARLFPTPANDVLQMNVENGRSVPSAADIQVIGADGRVALHQNNVLETGSQMVSLKLSELSSGSYIVVLRVDGAELSLPFVIAR